MIIAVAGRAWTPDGHSCSAGAGKTTVCDVIDRIAYTDVRVLHFAGPMKEIVRDVFGFSQVQLYGTSEDRSSPDERYPLPDGSGYLTARLALQTLGKWGTSLHKEIWAKHAVRRALSIESDYHSTMRVIVAIDGLRFPWEIDAVRRAGGYVVLVDRPVDRLGDASGDKSETALRSALDSDFDYVVRNDGCMRRLEKNVLDALTNLLARQVQRAITYL